MKSPSDSQQQSFFFRARTSIHHLKPKGRFLLAFGMIGMIIGMAGMMRQVFVEHTIVRPAFGGRITEGIVGAPRFVNPILAESRVDRDLVRLTYSGLMRQDQQGNLIPDLAESYSISEDQKTYTFTLKSDARFHDGNRITSSDVAFTLGLTQVSTLQSPVRDAWQDIVIETPDNETISFTLPQPFAGFLHQTTLGVLPSHIWQSVPIEQVTFSEYNSYPIVGSGPFEVDEINRNRAGVPIRYRLRPYRNYWLEVPHVRRLTIAFYPTEAALLRAFESRTIDTMSAISSRLVAGTAYSQLISATLPRVFGIFFNETRQPLFGDEATVTAIHAAIDKQVMVQDVLGGFGQPLVGPLPPTLSTLPVTDSYNPETAKQTLEDANWELRGSDATVRTNPEGEPLQFTLATSDVPELKQTAEIIKRNLADIGILVTINVFEIGKLESEIIQPRNFEALLFGQVIRHDTDTYAFWHSSQAGADGLNITNYTNSDVDEALEAALATRDVGLRTNLYRTVEEEIVADQPGIFLYAPDFVYMTNTDIGNFDIGTITEPADRLWGAPSWYVATERIWEFFRTSQD